MRIPNFDLMGAESLQSQHSDLIQKVLEGEKRCEGSEELKDLLYTIQASD